MSLQNPNKESGRVGYDLMVSIKKEREDDSYNIEASCSEISSNEVFVKKELEDDYESLKKDLPNENNLPDICVKKDPVDDTSFKEDLCTEDNLHKVIVKKESELELSSGVSEAAEQAGLYKEHEVKNELVIGPEVLQLRDSVRTSGQAEIIKKLDALQADVNDVKVSLASLQQQQNINTIKIMTMLDKMNKHFKMASGMREPAAGSVPDDDDILKKYVFPLDNLAILKDLDRDLSQEIYFKDMMKHFCSFVGADGQGRGEILGKKMAEQIMTRDLMTKMSWTGVSRTAEFQKKFAFQTLENVVKLFHNVLLKADSRWSHDKNEKLFSAALLKHAKKRAIAEKEKAEKRKKTLDDYHVATPSNISETEEQEKPTKTNHNSKQPDYTAEPSETPTPEARESSIDEDTE